MISNERKIELSEKFMIGPIEMSFDSEWQGWYTVHGHYPIWNSKLKKHELVKWRTCQVASPKKIDMLNVVNKRFKDQYETYKNNYLYGVK